MWGGGALKEGRDRVILSKDGVHEEVRKRMGERPCPPAYTSARRSLDISGVFADHTLSKLSG